MVPFPLLTPQTLLWTRLPSVARLNARGPQGRSVLQGSTLDGSGAFRSGTPPPCTVWPRTVMRGKLHKVNSGHNSVPKAARRTEPSPRFPRLAARPKGVAARRRVWGSQEGEREPYGALFPFCPCRGHGIPPPPKAATVHAHFERKVASTGEPLYRRKVSRLLTAKQSRARCPRKRPPRRPRRSAPPRERSGRARPRRPSPRAHCAAKARALRPSRG